MMLRAIFVNGIGVGLLLGAFIFLITPHAAPQTVDVTGLNIQMQHLQTKLTAVTAHAAQLQQELLVTKNELTARMKIKQNQPNGLAQAVTTTKTAVKVTINSGMTVDQVGALLQQQGVIGAASMFTRLAKNEPFIHAGHYRFYKNENIPEIIVALTATP